MMAHAAEQLMTAEELSQLADDGCMSHELDEGRLIEVPPSKYPASWVSARFLRRIGSFVDDHQLGIYLGEQGGVQIGWDPDTVRAPDVSFYHRDRLKDFVSGYPQGAPDLVVEVLSESVCRARVTRRVQLFLRAGARLIWIIDPADRSAEVYRPGRDVLVLDEDGILDGEDVLPGFSLALSEVWA
jgi:Uma2 family endonuclease